MNTEKIRVIAFDADDTLWDCQGHFEVVMQNLYDELTPWVDRETAALELFSTERKNMRLLGFGVKAFTLSMLETAMRVSRFEMPGKSHQSAHYRLHGSRVSTGRCCSPSDERNHRGKPLVVFTKGELLDQEHKLERSGLLKYFCHVEITSDKGEVEFRNLCRRLDVQPESLLMVGNSLKSDIAPALSIGCQAVYVPFHVTWQLEHAEHF